jgi:16S rRNA (adenine1518-N6/adenine1519-N6)-dimethyltransferase
VRSHQADHLPPREAPTATGDRPRDHTAPPAPRRALSQNFLCAEDIARAIVDATGVDAATGALEIGPGRGALTFMLAERARRLVAVELDEALADWLTARLAERGLAARIVRADFLEANVPELLDDEGPFVAVGNVPYAVTTPILIRLLQHVDRFARLVLMVQQEVAERWCAAPGGREYGSISVWCRYWCEAEIVRRVRPGCFHPAPRVSSAVVCLTPRPPAERRAEDPAFLEHIVRSAFHQRRKRAANSLADRAGLATDRAGIEAALAACNIDIDARAEAIGVEAFVDLANRLLPFRASEGDAR